MTKIELEIHDDVISTLYKIRDINDTGIELDIPEGSVLFENVLNLKLLEKEADEMGKVLHFKTYDEAGLNLITAINDEGSTTSSEDGGIIEYRENTSSIGTNSPSRVPMALPRVSLPKISIPSIQIPNIRGKGLYVVIATILLLVIGGGVVFASNAPKAQVKIIVSPQTLTKSVPVKVKNGATTSNGTKLLRGFNIDVETTETQSIPTTGEKTIGEKAEGEVKIFNFTSTDTELKKGTELEYKDYKFVLKEGVTVSAQTVDTTTTPPTSTPGTVEAKVTAFDIGENYNISKDKSLDVGDYKTSEIVATSTADFKGGESKKVKVVAPADITSLSSKVLTANQENGQKALTGKLGKNQKLINGSTKTTLITETYTAKDGEEKDELELTQTIKTYGLVYATDEMDSLMNELIKTMVPEGYVLSTEDRKIEAEVLGNSDTSILNSEEADLQVTLKTFVIPEIKEDQVKKDLAGKSPAEAEKVLGGIRNIKTYSLDINPSIPFMKKVPNNLERISVEIETEK